MGLYYASLHLFLPHDGENVQNVANLFTHTLPSIRKLIMPSQFGQCHPSPSSCDLLYLSLPAALWLSLSHLTARHLFFLVHSGNYNSHLRDDNNALHFHSGTSSVLAIGQAPMTNSSRKHRRLGHVQGCPTVCWTRNQVVSSLRRL